MKVKKIIALSVSVVAMLNFATAVFAEEKEIQLTDYRYENVLRGLNGYNFCNIGYYKELRGNWTTDSYDDSVVLKPDGTELFQQGKYYLMYDYSESHNPGDRDFYFTCSFPQYKNMFTVRENSDKSVKIINDKGEVIAEADNSGRIPTSQKTAFINDDLVLFGAPRYKANGFSDTAYIDMLLRISDKKFLINNINSEDGYEISDFKINYDEKTYFVVYLKMEARAIYNYAKKYDFEGNDLGKCSWKDVEGGYSGIYFPMDYYKFQFGKGVTANEDDTSYEFRQKNIDGKNYYALFKIPGSDENSEDYIPKDTPSDMAKENIIKATNENLLYNNANCRYQDPISRQDFCIYAVEAYCKLQGMDIDEYIKNNDITLDYDKFKDTDNVYVLLADKLGIMNGTEENTFSPTEYMTRQQAAVVINNIANLTGLKPNAPKVNFIDTKYYASWAKDAIFNVTSINNIKGSPIMQWVEPNKFSPWMYYTREQAYTDVYTIYEMCK